MSASATLNEATPSSEKTVPLLLQHQEEYDLALLLSSEVNQDYVYDAEVGGFRLKPSDSEILSIEMTVTNTTTTIGHSQPDKDEGNHNDIDYPDPYPVEP